MGRRQHGLTGSGPNMAVRTRGWSRARAAKLLVFASLLMLAGGVGLLDRYAAGAAPELARPGLGLTAVGAESPHNSVDCRLSAATAHDTSWSVVCSSPP